MATTGDLIDLVFNVIKDDDYDEDAIQDLLNEGLTYVAAQVLLPSLDTTATVTTGAGQSVALPTDFMRNLYRVAPMLSDTGRWPRIELLNNPGQFRRMIGARLNDPGDAVHAATVLGASLAYWPIPITPQAMDISYYRKPDLLVVDDDIPVCLPEAYHSLLADYACYRLWARIEDGIEGQKVNTKFALDEVARKLAELSLFVDQGQSHPPAPVVAGDFL